MPSVYELELIAEGRPQISSVGTPEGSTECPSTYRGVESVGTAAPVAVFIGTPEEKVVQRSLLMALRAGRLNTGVIMRTRLSSNADRDVKYKAAFRKVLASIVAGSVSPETLISVLGQAIKCRRTMLLIESGVKAGYIYLDVGRPGSNPPARNAVCGPLTAIYLHTATVLSQKSVLDAPTPLTFR